MCKNNHTGWNSYLLFSWRAAPQTGVLNTSATSLSWTGVPFAGMKAAAHADIGKEDAAHRQLQGHGVAATEAEKQQLPGLCNMSFLSKAGKGMCWVQVKQPSHICPALPSSAATYIATYLHSSKKGVGGIYLI